MSTDQAASPQRTLRHRAVRALRDADRRAGKHDRTRRLRDVIGDHRPWWDWGHRLMALVGRNDSGNWGPPRGRDLYVRVSEQRRPDGSAIPGTARQPAESTDGWAAWQGAKRGEEWKTFDWQDDGSTLVVGWLGDDGRIRPGDLGSYAGELRRFRRWFIWESWARAEWFGLRPWLYYRGLHAAVDEKIPGTCQLVPPSGTGGYDHWHCQVRVPLKARLSGRRTHHDGEHRFRNYTWSGAVADKVKHAPLS